MSASTTPLYPGTALVTGGGSGLGLAIARELVARRHQVIITGRNPSTLDRAARELGDSVIRAVTCDSSDPDDVETLVDTLRQERISILINNAGIGGPVSPLIETAVEDWDEVFAINVRGVFLMCRAFAPQMVQRGNGFILNIASVTGKRPLENRTPYAASKMAVIGLTSTLATELSRHGVMVNSLSPGPIVSDRMDRNLARESALTGKSVEEVTEAFTSRAALRRMVTNDEVAQAAATLVTIPGLTGSDIDFSGGMVA